VPRLRGHKNKGRRGGAGLAVQGCVGGDALFLALGQEVPMEQEGKRGECSVSVEKDVGNFVKESYGLWVRVPKKGNGFKGSKVYLKTRGGTAKQWKRQKYPTDSRRI